MKNIYPYLRNITFLNNLFHRKVITYFSKITALDWDENELESIEGKVINASFNVDGSSSVRRTGNMTLLLENINKVYNIQSLFSINKKVNVEIGLKNTTNLYTNYPIIWFPIGIYVINNVSISRSTSEATIQMQLQDKMCLLNGTCGGTLPATTIFDTLQTIDHNGNIIQSRPTIYQIIVELVNHFGKEALHKIIVSDIQERIKQVMKWTGANPLYMLQKNGEQNIATVHSETYMQLKQSGWQDIEGSPFEYGTDVGYIYTDFSYPGQLIGQAGAAITDILDKIKNTLGNYQYFYDINGNFIFQEIKNFLNNSHAKLIIQELNNTNGNLDIQNYLLDLSHGKSQYTFNDLNLITSYSNTPQYNMIKNDFVIWGYKKTSGSSQIPIRYHLAIDKKPEIGNTYQAFVYIDPNDNLQKWFIPYEYDTRNNFPEIGTEGLFYKVKNNNTIYVWGKNNQYQNTYIPIQAQSKTITTKDWRTELYFQGMQAQVLGTSVNDYYAELKNEWPRIYDIEQGAFKPNILKDVTQLNYFLDFIDTESNIMELSIDNIGKRSLVLTDDSVNCVFEPSVPDIIFIPTGGQVYIDKEGNVQVLTAELREECQNKGQNYIQVASDIYDHLAGGGVMYSGYQVIRQMLHQYTSYNESISMSCIPLYFLEPNTRITLNNIDNHINGDYMLTNYSINLDSNSLMNLNAIKALEKV